ncbi:MULTISPECIES: DUF6080 domain-containing protein [unclassified Kaistella]|uniref:DUF6080 domain-containing protein n=1 Tax=unclassified Kaistella TaxID=2762626 RepID=UPI002732598F|nr:MULTISPECIES: DUF6080 domain-containing protein [unclassified Kaistella]MDP2452902.1 DUF6080 domain-containing protein [Kaistella sp. SH11-4b]MDP2455811.1 DUF6080 domain-containing protein [Kaistella sp. SH40-3]MDP2458715.1 DUF6080 domain-containing protein [Kaistella sp. SH19-2b]
MPKIITLNLKQKFTDFLKSVFPATKFEIFLFILFLIAYGILGTVIALNYRIVFDDRIPWDAYFSFDNRAIVMTGGGFERHPLANYYFGWIREFSFLFSNGKKDEVFRLVLVWCSNVAVSLSLVQIYKYLKNIITLPKKISVLIVFFFSFFTTPILLSFTPETYTYTLFFLVLFNYYAALKLRKEEKMPAVAMTLAAVSIGGLTITNIVKVYIPLLFEKNVFQNWRKFGNLFFRVLISVSVFVLLFLYRLDFKFLNFLNKSGQQYEKFSTPKATPLWDMIASWFFGGNMLFSSFALRDYHSLKGFQFKALFMDVYSSVISYVFVGLILILILWSFARNFKNKFVQILMISFLVDIVIHCILKFGLHTSYIYGGHFIFVVPLMLGWLFYGYKDSPKTISFLYVTVSILFFYLAMNNIFRMVEFFDFLEKYYT